MGTGMGIEFWGWDGDEDRFFIPDGYGYGFRFKRYKKESGKEGNKTELDRYLVEDGAKSEDDFDVLQWWKLNSLIYPILSAMACDDLAVSISTVAFESAFSTSGHVLDAYRSLLTPKLAQALIYTQDWLCGSPIINSV
ncbi:hypothetical protein PTKIN_Ptkin13bG0023900 [Pterospermum kingtungense]